ncbi:hypothetical protein MRX96_004241 [Rhipicephalus microplus]
MPLLGDHRRPASRLARSVDPGGVRSGKLEKLVARTKSRFDVIGIPPTPAVRAPQQCFRPRLVLDSFRHCSDNNEETWYCVLLLLSNSVCVSSYLLLTSNVHVHRESTKQTQQKESGDASSRKLFLRNGDISSCFSCLTVVLTIASH